LIIPALLAALAGAGSDLVTDPPFRIPRLTRPVLIDGAPGEVAWAAIEPLPLVNLYPSFGSPLSEKTEIRVGHDDDFFYASIRAWDTEPKKIRATTLYRDRWETDDEFAVILDTFSDGQNGAMFLVTPAGVRIDNQLTHDAEPGRGEWMNRDWNVPWDAAARILDDGWTAEMRVPFSSLRFESRDGVVRMRLKAYRYLPRKGENQMFPPTRPDSGSEPHFKLSVAKPIELLGVESKNPVYVQPYVAGSRHRSAGPGGSGNVGLDVKFSPTRAMAVDLTLNTDFAQVEVDQQRINLTRFPLLFPERRPFFLERAGLLSVNLGGEDRLFHSRRIGLNDEGVRLPLRAGARLASRVAGWDVGLLNVQVGGSNLKSTLSENDSVVRVQRHGASGLAFGAAATLASRPGERLATTAVDLAFSRGQHKLTAVGAHSHGKGPRLERSRVAVRVIKGAESGLSYSGEYRFTGSGFEPALGFLRLKDAHEFDASAGQSWRRSPPSSIRRVAWRAEVQARHNREAGHREFAAATGEINLETSGGHFVAVRAGRADETLAGPFAVTPEVRVAPGSYSSSSASVFLASSANHPLRLFVRHERAGYYGGSRRTWSLEPLFIPDKRLQVFAAYEGSTLSGGGRPEVRLELVRGGVRAALTRKCFADVLTQRAPHTGASAGQIRLRYNFSEGHDLWIVGERSRLRAGAAIADIVTVKYTRLFAVGGGKGV